MTETFKENWDGLHATGYDAFSGKRVWNAIFHKALQYLNDENFVLDIGCGTGDLFDNIKSNVRLYCGIDISYVVCMKLLERFKNTKDSPKIGTIVPCNGDGLIPLYDKSFKFDRILSCLVFQHIRKEFIEKYLDESHRLLKENGLLIFHCTEWENKSIEILNHKDSVYGGMYSYPRKVMEPLLAIHKFKIIDFHEFQDSELESVGAKWLLYVCAKEYGS